MATIVEVLNARYPEVGNSAVVGLRQESGLNPEQIGAANIAEVDAYISRRIQARADRLTGVLQVAAGRYAWPFTEAVLADAYPNQDSAQRANTARIQLETAADSVAAGVLGDLFNRAAARDERYVSQRDFYIGDPSQKSDIGEAGRLARDVADMVAAAYQDVTGDVERRNQLNVIQATDPLALATESQYTPPRWFGE